MNRILAGVVADSIGLLSRARRTADRSDKLVVLTPATEGSLGDAAMLEGLLTRLRNHYGGSIVLMYTNESERHDDLVRDLAIEPIAATSVIQRPAAFVRLLKQTHTFWFVGADVVDGVYGRKGALNRLALVRSFAMAGATSAIVSFSWSEHPDPSVASAIRALPRSVDLRVRDPVSRRRVENLLGRQVTPVADLAFLLRPEPEGVDHEIVRWLEGQRARGRTLVGVCINRMLVDLKDVSTISRAETLVRIIVSQGHSILLIPHDWRSGFDDLSANRAVFQRLSSDLGDKVALVESQHSPSQTKWLAGRLDAVVSARMHFCIAALGQGVPAFSMAYQGKFEGLYELFGFSDVFDSLHVDAKRGFADPDRTAALISRFLTRREEFASTIARRLPDVLELSGRNLDGHVKLHRPA